MKKRVFVSAAMAALVLAAAGCSRTAPPLEHDAEIAALLAGRWQRELSLETQISTDEANPQRVTGTVGPPLMARSKCCLVKDLTTDTGPAIFANRLTEKLVPKGSPLRLPSGDAPISSACQR